MAITADDVLNTQAAADYIHVPAGTLVKWRHQKRGPRYTKLPNGTIFYRKVWLDEFFDRHSVVPTPPPIGGEPPKNRRRSKVTPLRRR